MLILLFFLLMIGPLKIGTSRVGVCGITLEVEWANIFFKLTRDIKHDRIKLPNPGGDHFFQLNTVLKQKKTHFCTKPFNSWAPAR